MAIKDLTKIEKPLFLCNGGSCKQLGSEESTTAIRACIRESGMDELFHTTKTLCNGRCKDGPIVIAQPDGIWFKGITKEMADGLVLEYLIRRIVPEDLVLYKYGKNSLGMV
jgi:(2Fe-2S) ferredoxin